MKKTPSPSAEATSTNRQSRIAETAYRLFEQRGRENGDDVEDWLEAERQVASAERECDKSTSSVPSLSERDFPMPRIPEAARNSRDLIHRQSTPFRTAARNDHARRSEARS